MSSILRRRTWADWVDTLAESSNWADSYLASPAGRPHGHGGPSTNNEINSLAINYSRLACQSAPPRWIQGTKVCRKITINDTIKLFSRTATGILVISNQNSLRVLFDKIASVYFIWKYIYHYFSNGNGQHRDRHCANCIGTLSSPVVCGTKRVIRYVTSSIAYKHEVIRGKPVDRSLHQFDNL